MIGPLPLPVWRRVADALSTRVGFPDNTLRPAVLELRRVCKALLHLVGGNCVGGAGWLEVSSVAKATGLEAAQTAGFGRALVVWARLDGSEDEAARLAIVAALALAVRRGHTIWFQVFYGCCVPAVEAVLVEASREGLLMLADLESSNEWTMDAMAQLGALKLSGPERATVADIVRAGTLRRIDVFFAKWADVSILSSLREVFLCHSAVEDLAPLANVPTLLVVQCHSIRALPAMHNDWLEVLTCGELADLSGLAGGTVGALKLGSLISVEDVGAIGAMRPPPRTVILKDLSYVRDVSMLAGVHRLEVIGCRLIDEAATLAALEGKVGTIQWVHEADSDDSYDSE